MWYSVSVYSCYGQSSILIRVLPGQVYLCKCTLGRFSKCSSLCRQRCEKYDVNLHNQNLSITHISIQPHFAQYATSLSGNPLSKVIALVMAWGFIWTWDNSYLPMQFDGWNHRHIIIVIICLWLKLTAKVFRKDRHPSTSTKPTFNGTVEIFASFITEYTLQY